VSASLYEDEIDLPKLCCVSRAGKIKIIVLAASFAVGAGFYAASITNQYKATDLLAPAQSGGGGLWTALGQPLGSASLVGVSIGGESSESQIVQEVMKSWSFVESFLASVDLPVEVYAAEGWRKSSGELKIGEALYYAGEKVWLIEGDQAGQPCPPASSDMLEDSTKSPSQSGDNTSTLVSASIHREGLSSLKCAEFRAGLSVRADTRIIFYVEANGSIWSSEKSLMYRENENVLRPTRDGGLAIPVNSRHQNLQPKWRKIDHILAPGTVSVAVVTRL